MYSYNVAIAGFLGGCFVLGLGFSHVVGQLALKGWPLAHAGVSRTCVCVCVSNNIYIYIVIIYIYCILYIVYNMYICTRPCHPPPLPCGVVAPPLWCGGGVVLSPFPTLLYGMFGKYGMFGMHGRYGMYGKNGWYCMDGRYGM